MDYKKHAVSRTKPTLFELRTTWVDGNMNLPQSSSALSAPLLPQFIISDGTRLCAPLQPPPPPPPVSVEDSEVEAHCVAALCQPKTSRDGESAQESKPQPRQKPEEQ